MAASDSWATAGQLLVSGGIEGIDWRLDGTIIHILTATPLTLKNAPASAIATTTITIDAGVHADLTFDGVVIEASQIPVNIVTNKYATADGSAATSGTQILPEKRTSLHLTLADGSQNRLVAKGGLDSYAALRCGEGSDLTIDDSVRNIDNEGTPIVPEKGLIPRDTTLANGTAVTKGSSLTVLDSANPGSLTVTGRSEGAGIGGCAREAGGTMTFNGGNITVSNGTCYSSAGIGGGGYASGTATEITFNGGTYNIKGGVHGAGVGAGGWVNAYNGVPTLPADYILDTIPASNGQVPVGGNITINGGYLISEGGWHGAGFGAACGIPPSNKGCTIRITGGTLLPKGAGAASGMDGHILPDLGGREGYVIIEGGSVYVSGTSAFIGVGDTAWGNDAYLEPGYDVSDPDDPNKVFLVTIDLSEELRRDNEAAGIEDGDLNNTILSWHLSVGGETYTYGAPSCFDDGKLYLWLPKDAPLRERVSVSLTFRDNNGDVREVLPLFREPGQVNTLKRYQDFEITDPAFLSLLTKPYDGLPLATYDLSANPITTAYPDNKRLDKIVDSAGNPLIQYYYQAFDKVPDGGADPQALGPEIVAQPGAGGSILPCDEGAVLLTMVSKQYSDENSTDEDVREFAKSYWGHRALMWGQITPVSSSVASVKATWADGSSTQVPQPSSKTLNVSVDVTSGKDTATTCKAPTGAVQLYVDGEPVGEPVEMRFANTVDEDGNLLTANTQVATDNEGREHSVVSWSFTAGDYISLGARHTVSARYLPAINYLESANPAEEEVAHSTVTVLPDPQIAPRPTVAKTVENLTNPSGPTRIGDRLRYTVTLRNEAAGSLWTGVRITDELPTCLTLDETSLHLVNFYEDIDGAPVAGNGIDPGTWALASPAANGRRTLSVGVGSVGGAMAATLTFECTVNRVDFITATADDLDLANVAKAFGTRPALTTPVDPNTPMPDPADPSRPLAVDADPSEPAIAPGPGSVVPDDPSEGDISIAKTAENLSRNTETTYVGDTVRYTIVLKNSGADTCWLDTVIGDDIPVGLEPVAGTLRLAAPDGSEVTVDDAAYSADTRRIAVYCGGLYGGQQATLSFDTLVTEEAVGADIGNIAVGYGTPPSDAEVEDGKTEGDSESGKPGLDGSQPDDTSGSGNPSGAVPAPGPDSSGSNGNGTGTSTDSAPSEGHPAPGDPFKPAGDWDAWASTRDQVTSSPAFAPGTTAAGGVLAGGADDPSAADDADQPTRIRLAQTGDGAAALLLGVLATSLLAGAVVIGYTRGARRKGQL